MIKKLKLGLLMAVLSLALTGSANAAELTFSTATNISIGGYTYVISAASEASSLVVADNTITVATVGTLSFTLTSYSGAVFNNDGSLIPSCSVGTSTIVVPASSSAVAITPFVGATCASGSAPSSISPSPTSTVAQSTTPVTLTITPATSTTPEVTMTTSTPGCSGGNKYNTSTGALCVNNAVPANNIPGCGNRTSGFSTATGGSCAGNVVGSSQSSYNFGTATLKSGSKGDAVMELQRFLNAKLNLGLVVDGKLGPKTIAVIKKWQKDNGLVADGLIGAKTKAKMNAMAQ